jgi:diguanylate cyclase
MNHRILVIDDEAGIRDLYKSILHAQPMQLVHIASQLFENEPIAPVTKKYAVDTASQGEEGVCFVKEAITKNLPYTLAFIDMRMPPGWDGVTTAIEIRKVDPNIYIVFVTAYSDKNMAEIYQEIGQSDKILYLKKPFEFDEIRSIITMITKTYEKEIRLEERANQDGLTGLLTRRRFMEVFQTEFNRAQRYTKQLSLLMLDIDYFKKINDNHGHQAGDEVLKYLARTCIKSMRTIDQCGRYGGEEFIILLPEISQSVAVNVSERLRKEIENLKIIWKGLELSVTVSIGCTEYLPGYDKESDSMINRADQALYIAKEQGRNQTRVWVKNI